MAIFVDENTKVLYQGLTGSQGRVTSVTRLADGRLVSLLDVEQVLADAEARLAAATADPQVAAGQPAMPVAAQPAPAEPPVKLPE